MKKGFQIVFKRIRGRVIPIKQSTVGMPSEMQAVEHIRKARTALKEGKFSSPGDRKLLGAFYSPSKEASKIAGSNIAKRIARLSRK